MNIETLKRFAILAGCLNYTEAARRLCITQPGLSKSISELEKEVGTPLFNRASDLSLTPAGIFVRDHAEQMIFHYDAIMAEAPSIATKAGKGLTVSVPYATDQVYQALVETVRYYRTHHPYRGVRMAHSSNATMFQQLASGRIDLGTLILFEENRALFHTASDGTFALKAIATNSPVLFVPASHALAKKEVIGLHDLESLPLFVPTGAPYDTCILTINNLAQQYGLRLNLLRRNVATLEEMVVAAESSNGGGFLVGSQSVLDPEGRPELYPRLVKKTVFDPPLKSWIYFVYRQDDKNPMLQKFMEDVRLRMTSAQKD